MANIAASDISVVILNERRINGRSYFNCQLSFGDGVLTYPAGGIPINKAKFGTPVQVESLTVYDKGVSGYLWSYDRANEKLVALRTDQVDTPLEQPSTVAIPAQVLKCEVIGS